MNAGDSKLSNSKATARQTATHIGGRRHSAKERSIAAAIAEALEPRRLFATVLYEGFEGAFPTDNGWSVGDSNASGTPAYWGGVGSAFGGEAPYAGTRKGYCAATGYSGTTSAPAYQNYMTAYMSRSINLAGSSSASLSFSYKAPSIESSYDHLRVYIDSTILFDATTSVSSWTPATYNLSSYVGGAHTLKFEFYTGSTVTYEGVYLDDITVTGSDVPTAPANLLASDGTYADKVQLTWAASTGATAYEVWRNTTNSSSTATKITSTDVTHSGWLHRCGCKRQLEFRLQQRLSCRWAVHYRRSCGG